MKKKTRIIIIAVCVLVFLVSGSFLIYHFATRDKNGKIYKDTLKYRQEPKDEKEQPVQIPIDFAGLKQINDEIYAWIDIPDTNIHYPIVQSATDDSYYLMRTIERRSGYPGSIYTERINAKDFSDFNTVIYGHNMANGTMFKHIHKFEDQQFFNDHDTITVYTETKILTYKVYAAVLYDDRHILYTYNNTDIDDRRAFLASLRESRSFNNHFREEVKPDEYSHLITLSTCTNKEGQRYIVVGVLTK